MSSIRHECLTTPVNDLRGKKRELEETTLSEGRVNPTRGEKS